MREHPVEFTEHALEEIIRQEDDPDEQDALIDRIADSLQHFPRRFGALSSMGSHARLKRDERWNIVFDIDKTDPLVPPGQEEEEVPGATVFVRHVWRNQRQIIEELTRPRLT